MSDKLIIAVVNANPSNFLELSLPLLQATVAASMEYDVEVIFSGRAGKIAIVGEAEKISDENDPKKSIQTIISEAYDAGVLFKVCTPALEIWGDTIIPEINEIVGGTYLISEAMDSNTVTFTY